MKATLSTNKAAGFNRNHRKENGFYKEYLVIQSKPALPTDPTETPILKQVISCRMYSTQATNFCAIWIHGENTHKSGTGKAGGYGYHRESAAAQEAIEAAGYKLDESISGVGESAIERALKAICELEGFGPVHVFTSHA